MLGQLESPPHTKTTAPTQNSPPPVSVGCLVARFLTPKRRSASGHGRNARKGARRDDLEGLRVKPCTFWRSSPLWRFLSPRSRRRPDLETSGQARARARGIAHAHAHRPKLAIGPGRSGARARAAVWAVAGRACLRLATHGAAAPQGRYGPGCVSSPATSSPASYDPASGAPGACVPTVLCHARTKNPPRPVQPREETGARLLPRAPDQRQGFDKNPNVASRDNQPAP